MENSPIIIAEIGQNHNGDMGLASELIWAAKQCGADIAKFQLFDAKKLFSKRNNPWYDYNLRTELNYEQLLFIAEVCFNAKIEFMASAFDRNRVDWLNQIGVKRHKVASRSIRDLDLIEHMKLSGKPIIASLGMWQEQQFPEWLTECNSYFLYCISEYPTELEKLKFNSVDFRKYSGFSDHTVGTHASFIAMSRGAKIIEKHFTLAKTMYGPDHSCSMTPDELISMSDFARNLRISL